ncbi:S8 family peptidase [Streptomyces buecherae]|uniref:S8 family peptidase n=1 Tax=Streptomyces buecherae TaxID=2763006 RepID=UPI0037B10701
MNHRKRRASAASALAVAAALAAALLGTPESGAAQLDSGTAGTAHALDKARTVTLVTGDRVTLDATGQVTRVRPGKGREGTAFRIARSADRTYVVPRDAERLLANGTADRRLFDVTQLVKWRYDDAARPDLPLIVTYAKGRTLAPSTLSAAGARVGRDLPSVNGDALKARKSKGADLWETLTGSGGTARERAAAADRVERIWLDGKVEAALDRSTAQIGAPEAWATGYDGTGVKVAVLDTGVDGTHPDLKGRIDAAKNFTEATDTVDRVGHGTHVASTVAGSGAHSGGTYQGVAPGARLISGKVLDDEGYGEESGIIAGAQWAIAQGAKVINLSLGGPDTPGDDLLEQAVNDLSATSGALFVIAAGNEGPAAGTVGSPGSAAAALTVGAVDRADTMADFSSRGPTADGSLKPDLTAPGVDIVAAKAAEGTEGAPAADGYVSMSGTSMATPHVAGAAAILAQRHPDWTGERLKAALTASAKPTPGVSAFAQGTGRTDIAHALDQRLTTSPATLGFPTQQWPHTDDRPVTKTVTYRNDGDRPLILDLTTEVYGEDGRPAAEGMLEVSPKRLTIPAGGTATAQVTADSRAGTADGGFGGSVTATDGAGVTARTGVGLQREVESYDLTVRHLDLRGKPAGRSETGVQRLDSEIRNDYSDDTDGEFTVRLPRGRYSLEGRIDTGATPDAGGLALLLNPKFSLTRDTTLVMDARQAEPVRITVPDARAKHTAATFTYGFDIDRNRSFSTYEMDSFGKLRVGQFGARLPAREAFAQYNGVWTHGSTRYRPAVNRTGDLTGFTANLKRSQFAKVTLPVGEPAKDKKGSLVATPLTPGGQFWDVLPPTEFSLPTTLTDYVLPGVRWRYSVEQMSGTGADGDTVHDAGQWTANPRAYSAGKQYTERFNTGVFGPHLTGPLTGDKGRPGAVRVGDTFTAYLPLFSDGAGHVGDSRYRKARSTLYAGGTKIFAANTDLTDISYELPAAQRTYRLTTDVSRPTALSSVSTRVAAEWTFTSAHVTGAGQRLPLSVVRFTPRLSSQSTAKAGTRFSVPFTVEGAATARTARKLAFSVSYDDGRTWQPAKAVDGKRLDLRHPAKAGTVSLRATLTDAAGNTLKQTIHRAYRIAK